MEHCTEMDSIYDFFHPCRHLNTWWNSSLKRQDSGTDYIQSYQKKTQKLRQMALLRYVYC